MNPEQSTDHDLIVEIKTELKLFREESRTTNNYTREQLIKLGENKLEKDVYATFLFNDKQTKDDHETRLRFLEKYAWLAIGAIGVAEVLLGWYIKSKP